MYFYVRHIFVFEIIHEYYITTTEVEINNKLRIVCPT